MSTISGEDHSAWWVNPAWQNFSSLFREANTALEAGTALEKSHHLTASLYFAIATLEAFLNQQMRKHLAPTKTETEIIEKLRKGRFLHKVKRWPNEITGSRIDIRSDVLRLIEICNELRGELTHPKTAGHDLYNRLLAIEPMSIVDAVAQFIVSVCEAQKVRYPYWLFGWNYLNPRKDAYEIVLINDQQFCHSLAAMGFSVPAWNYDHTEQWKTTYLGTRNGYEILRDFTRKATNCEPKHARFPYQPKLCRRWWMPEHQRSCGNVSPAAIAEAIKLDEMHVLKKSKTKRRDLQYYLERLQIWIFKRMP